MGRDNESCFMGFGRQFLIFINLVSAVLGLLLCAGGAYLYIEYDDQFSELMSPAPIIGVMIAGLCLFIITVFGVFGAVTGKKWVLTVYLILVVVILAIEVGAAVIFLDYLNVIESSQESSSSDLQDSTEIAINNFIYSSYQTCCVETELCRVNYTNVCTPVELCTNATTSNEEEACVRADSLTSVDVAVCTALQEVIYMEHAIVDEVTTGNSVSCGGGDPEAFEAAITGWIQENIRFFGYGALGVGIVQVLIVLSGMALLFVRPNLIPRAEEIDESSGTYNAAYARPVVPSSRYSVDRSEVSSQRFSVQRSASGRYSVQDSSDTQRDRFSGFSGRSGFSGAS
ncbi:Hypothetical Protein FCC1311_069982 [Hondaea fermentalgiana]|uniref:Tetraspanin n=1 Tax=Hondaea fermentalgiana TaxID=2315210 RepID=A0A2R5GM13_9STRA|nr:Hypothetical Protein FCC1311_069982 [Hondaea fermentalgiana]|eukprot:GBG30778.1 Hypothetical Protein FCC1311_069982 [Hondaea fermentalgiana]